MLGGHRIDHRPGAFDIVYGRSGGRAPNEGRRHKIPGRNHGPASQGTSDAFPVNGQRKRVADGFVLPGVPALCARLHKKSDVIRFQKRRGLHAHCGGVFLPQRPINLEQFFHVRWVQATHEVKFPLQQPLVFSSHVRGK